jgi:hypothetical protein
VRLNSERARPVILFFKQTQMDPNDTQPKRSKTEEQHLLDAIESRAEALSLRLAFTETAVRDLKDEHNRVISRANRQFSELLRRSRPSNEEMLHQTELRCMRLEGENASLRAARERDLLRLKELELAEAARERAWAGLEPSEIRLIVQYERQAFESAPDSCVQRRLELLYNRQAIEQTRALCAERIRKADEQARLIPQMEERALAAEAKAAHIEQQWLVLRGRVQGCEAEAAAARNRLAELTKELLDSVEVRRCAEARLAAALSRTAQLEAEVGSQRAEIDSLRTTGAGAHAMKECARQMEAMKNEHGAELDALRAMMSSRVKDLKLKLDTSRRKQLEEEKKKKPAGTP